MNTNDTKERIAEAAGTPQRNVDPAREAAGTPNRNINTARQAAPARPHPDHVPTHTIGQNETHRPTGRPAHTDTYGHPAPVAQAAHRASIHPSAQAHNGALSSDTHTAHDTSRPPHGDNKQKMTPRNSYCI